MREWGLVTTDSLKANGSHGQMLNQRVVATATASTASLTNDFHPAPENERNKPDAPHKTISPEEREDAQI